MNLNHFYELGKEAGLRSAIGGAVSKARPGENLTLAEIYASKQMRGAQAMSGGTKAKPAVVHPSAAERAPKPTNQITTRVDPDGTRVIDYGQH